MQTLGEALAGTGRPLVATSVTEIGTEDDAPDPNAPAAVRIPSEREVIALAARGVRAVAVRLPPSVHDGPRRGFTSMLIDTARRTGVSAYVDDGAQRWAAVHRRDAGRLFCTALQTAAPGSRLHAVDERGVPVRRLAEVTGQRLGLPVRSIPEEQAARQFGPFAGFLCYDNPVSSDLTRERTGWAPDAPGLLTELGSAEDLRRGT